MTKYEYHCYQFFATPFHILDVLLDVLLDISHGLNLANGKFCHISRELYFAEMLKYAKTKKYNLCEN